MASVEDWGAFGVGAMNLKNLFGQIQTDGANLFDGTAPLYCGVASNGHVLAP